MSINAIQWTGESLRLLDQTRLPHDEVYLEACSSGEVARAIAEMRVRGAPAIGVAAAYGVYLAARQIEPQPASQIMEALNLAAQELRNARPTAVNLAWAVERMLMRARDGSTLKQVQERLLEEAQRIQQEDVAANRAIGRYGAGLLPPAARVITHCNTGALATAGYGTALGVVRAAWEQGKLALVYVLETRPLLQGARLTAWELQQEGIPFRLVVDSAAGSLLRRQEAACVVVGADRIAANGDVANKVGTYSLAVLARENRIPFYVAAPVSTIDLQTPSGEAIPLEERAAEEVTHLNGSPIAPQGAQAINPAFDITPARYVTAIVTERGVVRQPYGERLRRLLAIEESTPG